MKVRDIMTTDVAMASPDMTLDEIATMMREEDTGAIPVVDEDESLIGIITDRDIVVRCVAEGKDPSDVTAEEVMTENTETIASDCDVKDASRLMAGRQVRRLPVCDGGKLIGMLSLGDLAVKTEDDRRIGETLEDVSEGVKAGGGGVRRASSTASPRADKAREVAGPAEQKVQGGGKAQERANVRQGRQQAISNQGAGKERQRQQRVVPIREEGKAPNRRKAS